MDFTRQEGESERAYYSRVRRELLYGARKKVETLELYQAGKATIAELESALLKLFSKGKKAPKQT